ncbi:MAG: stage V sporulation protein B [Bacillota bacterium]|nr:stage V sporulation protein B [Bacillota bacterium]
MSKKSFISGAIILMMAGFIVKIFGFIYRIYLSNLIGSEGIGLFQLISPVYSLIIMTLTSGVSIAVSKMVAEEHAKNNLINLRRITYCALVMSVIAGIAVSTGMYIFLDFISKVILKDSRTYLSLLILIPCIPVIAAASALKGYYYGIQQVVPTAISQIFEQVVKISIVIILASRFIDSGLEYACAMATLGMALGEIANLSVLMFVYKFRKKKGIKNISKSGILRKRKIVKDIIGTAFPVSVNRFITSIMGAFEFILIPRRLLVGGLSYTKSMMEYGKLTGMAMPLITFPCLVTSSLAITLVPAISEAISLKHFRSVNYRISKSIQLTFILGFIFTSIFLAYPNEIGGILYRREKIGDILYILAFTCIFTYLQQTLLGVLNGMGKQAISLRNSIIGSAIRITFVYFAIPIYGLKGYVLGIIISSAFVCILNFVTVIKTTGMSIDFKNWLIKPGIVGGFMFFVSKYVYSFFDIFTDKFVWNTAFALMGNISIGLILMTLIGVLKTEEIRRLLKIKRVK